MKARVFGLVGCVALLLGSDGGQLTTHDLPQCAPDTYLLYRGGKVVCASKQLPNCTGQLLTITTVDGRPALSCTAKYSLELSAADQQQIVSLNDQVQGLMNQLNAPEVNPLLGSWVGLTTATTTGRIEAAGFAPGLPAANARCAKEFGSSAHMCLAAELFSAALNNQLNPDFDIPKGWVYMPTWNTPIAGAVEPLAGLADSCGGYTVGTTDAGWSGMAMDFTIMLSGIRGIYFNSGPLAPCDQPLPIACCK